MLVYPPGQPVQLDLLKDERMTESKKKLIVVSNRLPLTVKKEDGVPESKWKLINSSGGLVSALNGLRKEYDFLWIGWPGILFH